MQPQQVNPHEASSGTPVKPRSRGWRRLLWLPVLFVVFSALQVLVLRWVNPPFSSMMAWRQVEALTTGDRDFRMWHDWRDLNRMSPYLPLAVMASEDQKFRKHEGFDIEAIEKARANNARGRKLRGASTISQQTAKNLFLWSGRSWLRKGLEVWYTLLMETLWPKSRIMEMYLNVAEFGDGVYGAQAASVRFYGRHATNLSAEQAARLAAVLPSPRRYSVTQPGPYVQRRTGAILRQMRAIGGPGVVREMDGAKP